MSTLSALFVPRGANPEHTRAALRVWFAKRSGQVMIRSASDFPWIRIDLGRFDDGRLARELSLALDVEVSAATIQTAASVFAFARYRRGECLRKVAVADGAAWEVVGAAEPWEALFFDADDGEDVAHHLEDPAERKAVLALYAGKQLVHDAEWPIAGSAASYDAVASALGLGRIEELFDFNKRAAVETVGRASHWALAVAIGFMLLFGFAVWLGATQ